MLKWELEVRGAVRLKNGNTRLKRLICNSDILLSWTDYSFTCLMMFGLLSLLFLLCIYWQSKYWMDFIWHDEWLDIIITCLSWLVNECIFLWVCYLEFVRSISLILYFYLKSSFWVKLSLITLWNAAVYHSKCCCLHSHLTLVINPRTTNQTRTLLNLYLYRRTCVQ